MAKKEKLSLTNGGTTENTLENNLTLSSKIECVCVCVRPSPMAQLP